MSNYFKEFVAMSKDVKEFVNADALEQYFRKGNIKRHKIYEGTSFANSAFLVDNVCHTVRNFPRADVVEVVRCKDCGMSRETEDEEFKFCMQFADTVHSQAFCSYGKRKEVESDEL